jgi:hypothetical protein
VDELEERIELDLDIKKGQGHRRRLSWQVAVEERIGLELDRYSKRART